MTLSRVKRACDEGSFQTARTVSSETEHKMELRKNGIKGECAIKGLLRGRKKDGDARS